VVDESGASTIVDCPKCGQNVWIPAASSPAGTASRNTATTSPSTTPNFAVSLLCIGLGLGLAWFLWANKPAIVQRFGSTRSETEYLKSLVELKDFMVVSAAVCDGLCNKHSSHWRSAITSEYGNINAAIAESLEAGKETINQVNSARDTIENSMRQLNNPPSGYEQAHLKLVELFGIYNQLVKQAVSPSGSLESYNQDVNKLTGDFTKVVSELNVLMPLQDAPRKGIQDWFDYDWLVYAIVILTAFEFCRIVYRRIPAGVTDWYTSTKGYVILLIVIVCFIAFVWLGAIFTK